MSKPDENGILVQELRVYRKVDHASANGWEYFTTAVDPGNKAPEAKTYCFDAFVTAEGWQLHKRHLVRIPVEAPLTRELVRPAIDRPHNAYTDAEWADILLLGGVEQ